MNTNPASRLVHQEMKTLNDRTEFARGRAESGPVAAVAGSVHSSPAASPPTVISTPASTPSSVAAKASTNQTARSAKLRLGDAPIRTWSEDKGPYQVRFARSADDRRAVQSLRYEIFSQEMGAQVIGAEQELDLDPLDDRTDHLMVIDRATQNCVGGYRLATHEHLAEIATSGFYTERIFEMDRLDPSVRLQGVELGRACVAKNHRTRGAFQLLLRGIGTYLRLTEKRYLFGCGSVPLDDPKMAPLIRAEIEKEGWLDPSLPVSPTPAYTPKAVQARALPDVRPEVPALLYAYCAIGARLAPAPAYDPDFETLDFFVLLDLERVNPRVYARYCLPA